jgi:hypothetical protein
MNRHLSRHLSDDELLDRLYGLGESSVPHLQACEQCSGRLQEFERRRTEIVSEAEPSNEFLMAQRRAIYAQLDKASVAQAHWAPAALAVAFLLVMGVFLARPHAQNLPVLPPAPVLGVEMSDAQLFSDLYSMEQSVEPRAAAPIHGLFEAPEPEAEQ